MTDRELLKIYEAALREIETICIESASHCRKRMGTRVGNCLATARTALDHPQASGGND